jgi:DNA polymerase IV
MSVVPDAVRSILHVDMDAFFAAIEQRDDPSLRGKPILVGGRGNRGVVSTASYEARVFGCRSAMPVSRALRLCPEAIVVPTRFKAYKEASQQVRDIFERYTDQIQPISIDEAFLDVTGCRRLFGGGVTIAKAIRRDIFEATKLTASVGVAPNKFLAKLASDLDKPDGLTVITPETIDTILPPLPLSRIWGIGPKAAGRLAGMGLKTIGDLRRMEPAWFGQHFGSWGGRIQQLIHGIDDRPVECDGQAKSIGHEQTFGVDLIEKDQVRDVLLQQADAVGARIRRQQFYASGVTVKIRFGNFQTITRSARLPNPTDRTMTIYRAARALFDAWAEESFQPVRLIGTQTTGFVKEAQLGLFQPAVDERQGRVDQAVDAIKNRFGTAAIRRGRGVR